MHKKLILVGPLLLLALINGLFGFQLEKELPFTYSSFQLENGLTVILSEDVSIPLVTVVMGYKVGSIHDPEGKSGMAYLVQNLMFQGSRNVGRMQHLSLIQRIGGELNATTETEKTLYYQTVPSNLLATILWLESDRMLSLNINVPTVEQVKDALIGELRQRNISNPYLEGSRYFNRLLFPDFPYHHPVRGNEDDLAGITADEVRDFYSTYYTPNNAVLCIVGDLKKNKTIDLVRRYFQTIPKGKPISEMPPPKEKAIIGITTSREIALANSPGFYLGYRVAPPQTPDFYTLQMLEYILLKGNSSRLHKELVKKERVAFELNGSLEVRKDQAAFIIFALNNNEIMKERSQREILSELTKLAENRISDNELQKAKNLFKVDYVKQYAAPQNRALFLAQSHLAEIPLEALATELDKYLSVTWRQISFIAGKYFNQDRIVLNITTR